LDRIDHIALSSTADTTGTARKRHLARVSSESAPEAAGDSVQISGSHGKGTKKRKTAAKHPNNETSPSPPQSAPPQSEKESLLLSSIDREARKANLEEIYDLKEKLEKGALKGEAFSAAAGDLAEYAQDKSDPIIQRIARNLLNDYVDFGTPEMNWMMKIGTIDGPVKYLNSMRRYVDDTYSKSYLGDSSRFPEFLKALARSTAGAPVPQEALKTVSRLGNSLICRSMAKLSPEVRKNEPEEKDLYWGVGCASLIDFWWNNGQIEVHRNGEVIKPGSMDMREILFTGKVAVRGSAIELDAPPGPHALKEKSLAREIMKEIDPHGSDDKSKDKGKDKGIRKLQELYQSNPSLAAKVMDVIIDEAQSSISGNEKGKDSPQWGVSSISRLLFHARDNDWLKDLLKDHLPTLRDFPQKAHSYSMLSENNLMGEDYVKFCGNLAGAFPQELDPAFIRDGLSLMLNSDEINTREEAGRLAMELWKKHPGLVSPTLEMVLRDTGRPYLEDDQWSLIHEAAEKYEWTPEKPLMEHLTSRLYLPPGREKTSLFDGAGMKGYDLGGGIKFLTILLRKNPELVRGHELPDAQGKLVSVDRALIDRINNDPGDSDVLRHLYTKGGMNNDHYGRTAALYGLIQADTEIRDEMLRKVKEGYTRAGSISGMGEAEKRMLTMLYCLEPEKNQNAELREIFFKDMGNRQGFYVFSDMVDRVRREEISGGIEDLKKGSLAPEAHIDRARGAVAIAHNLGTSSDLGWNTGHIFEAMEEGKKTGNLDLKTAIPGLLSDLAVSLTKNGTVGAMPAKDLALVQIIEYLSRSDEDLKKKTLDILRPHLTIDQGYGNGVAVDSLDPFRKMEIEKQGGRLAGEGSLTRSERTGLYDKILAIGKTSYNFKEEEVRTRALSDFGKGLSGTPPPLGELPQSFTDPADAYKAYCGLMPGAEKNEDCAVEWAKLKDILKMVGGEPQLDLALDTYHFVEEMYAKGMDREKALAHALRCRSLGNNPREIAIQEHEASSEVHQFEIEENCIDISGVKLDIKKNNP